MLKSELVPFGDVADFDADDVISICPAKSYGYFYVWLRSKSKESPADSPSSPVHQLKAEIAALIPGIVTSFTLGDDKQFIALTNELRQLSAV